MNAKKASHNSALHQVERFRAVFNALEGHLKAALGKPEANFYNLMQQALQKGLLKRGDVQFLNLARELRNLLAHGKVEAFKYPALPAPWLVRQLEMIQTRLESPVRVIPAFQRKVETVQSDASLAAVLKSVHEHDYSQFPIYKGSEFVGLLTENGITRWLAAHTSREISLVELEEVSIAEVLASEELRSNHLFIPREATVEGVRQLFSDANLLEAVLITEKGRKEERLLGIATRWDIVQRPFE